MKHSKVRFRDFLRRRAVYLVLALCILAVGLSVTFMLINKENDLSLDAGNDTPIIEPAPDDPVVNPDDPITKPDDPVVNPNEEDPAPVQKPVSFIMPVLNATAITEYSETMVFNSTLNRYSSHRAMDIFCAEGSDVYAVYDGEIASIETTFLQGTTITIDHGNGLITKYNSLADGDSVTVGQKVSQGDVIGQVSLSNRQEYKSGAHLHFEAHENGQPIDPYKYLPAQEK